MGEHVVMDLVEIATIFRDCMERSGGDCVVIPGVGKVRMIIEPWNPPKPPEGSK